MDNNLPDVNDLIDSLHITPWKTMNGCSLWKKTIKMHNDEMSIITESLGKVTLQAVDENRKYSVPRHFVDNVAEWHALPPSEKEKYNAKADALRKEAKSKVLNYRTPTDRAYQLSCCKLDELVQNKITSLLYGRATMTDRTTTWYLTGENVCLDGLYSLDFPVGSMMFSSIFLDRLDLSVDTFNSTDSTISIELPSMKRAQLFFNVPVSDENSIGKEVTVLCPKVCATKTKDK
jgi:hypothetical protein